MFEAPDMHGLKVRSFTIVQLVHQEMPDLSAHLAEHLQNSLSLLFTDWLLTLCAGSVPLVPLSHLWDHFFDQGYSVIYRLILARLRCLRPWLLGETDFGALVHLVKNAHVDFVGPDDQPCPRPPRLPEPPEPPSPKTGGTSQPQPVTSRRKNLLRRLVRARDGARRSSLPPELGNSGVSEDEPREEPSQPSPRKPFCQSCEGAGSENCASWEKLVAIHLQAEVIDLARTAHYERMLAAPVLCPKSVEEHLREDNAELLAQLVAYFFGTLKSFQFLFGLEVVEGQGSMAAHAPPSLANLRLMAQNTKLKQELQDALQQVESLKREMEATRLRSRLVLQTCLRPPP